MANSFPWVNIHWAADNSGPAGGAGAPVPSPEPSSEPIAAPAPVAAPALDSAFALRDHAKTRGYDFSHFETDAAAADALFAAAEVESKRAMELQRQVAHYREHEAEFGEYLKAKQVPVAPPAPSVPEWDPSWAYQITRDERGNLVGDPGVIAKYKAHMEWRDKKFWADPFAGAEARIEAKLGELRKQLQQDLAQHDEMSQARQLANYIETNFTVAEQMQIKGDIEYAATELGLTSPIHRAKYALQLQQARKQAQGPSAPRSAPAAPTKGRTRQPSLTTIAAGAANSAPESFREQLAAAFKANGYTDDEPDEGEE